MMQSGYSGGRERWVAERSPIAQAVEHDGDFLDVGCANGLLADDLVAWSAEYGQVVVPHGVGRTWDFVYSLIDLAPDDLICVWLERLATWVTPGGRLISGSYRSRSREISPVDVSTSLRACGLVVTGTATGGDPPLTNLAWTDL